jgi:hypothetical protein
MPHAFGQAPANALKHMHDLPPLILYPCPETTPADEADAFAECDEATRVLLGARYAEFRMLCYVGRDINRWLEHCVEIASEDGRLPRVTETTFINLLLLAAPSQVAKKLRDWTIDNYQVIFARALGLNSVYSQAPSANVIGKSLLLDLYRYADALFDCRMKVNPDPEWHGHEFRFELYASGEYSRLFE